MSKVTWGSVVATDHIRGDQALVGHQVQPQHVCTKCVGNNTVSSGASVPTIAKPLMVLGSELPQEFVIGNSFPCQALGMLKVPTETKCIS